ncbi:TonB-dependent receptor [Sphingomonas sp. 2R-10]|uniref:TonB-dependent receptor domain-containing protein n=1 Tax=Sphingomonas sp. 2R-10 TaxID=3045148 RepID=UPI0024B9C70A|nr:TonB-dependent receptor [Sphingomonas sp. 2R-10]MDJ0276210.1 TonB-dependent receptor [Sphingomonas sp. 2R-10]
MADDIVVVGSKRNATMRTFAVQVDRITDIQPSLFPGSEALVVASTSLASTYRGAGRDRMFIRGIADSGFSSSTQAVAGLYLGDLRVGYSAPDPGLRLFDVATVEVLQGPQGTLYGSGALGGIVRIEPNRAVAGRWEGSVGGGPIVTAGGGAGADLNGVLNLPLGQRSAIRAVGYAQREGGFIDRPGVGSNANGATTLGGRLSAMTRIGEGWSADLTAIAQRIHGDDSHTVAVENTPTGVGSTAQEPYRSRYGAAHVVIAGRIGDADVRSSTGVTDQCLTERLEEGLVGAAPLSGLRTERMFVHETRIGRTADDGAGWVAGVAAARVVARFAQRDDLPVAMIREQLRTTTLDMGLYGEGAVRVAPGTLLGGGLRFSVISSASHPYVEPGFITPEPGVRRRDVRLIPSFSVVQDLAPGLTAFARYQEGFRPLSASSRLHLPGAGQGDRLRSTELGVRMARRRLSGSIGVIRSDWSDIQSDRTPSATFFANELGDAKIISLAAAAIWRPIGALTLNGSVLYNHVRLDLPPPFSGLPRPSGPRGPPRPFPWWVQYRLLSRLPNVAATTARVSATIRAPTTGSITAGLTVWGRYESWSPSALGPLEFATQPGYVRTGLNLDVTQRASTLSLSIDNLTDAQALRFVAEPSLTTAREQPTPLRPITFRIAFTRRFRAD